MKTIERRSIVKSAPLIVSATTAFSYQANSKVRFGIIGTGGRGQYVGTLMANDPNARITAICDRYADRIDAAKTKIPGADKATTYRDAQQLLADSNVDAVLIATPVFMHPEHFEAAIAAKKHIYCEKPAGADVAGCKRLLAAWEKRDKTKRIQFGFQQRFSAQYLKAHGYFTSGRIGEVKLMMSYWVLGYLPPTGDMGLYKDLPLEEQNCGVGRHGTSCRAGRL